MQKSRKDSLVSIIVPVYNSDKYLARCLDSLIDQTLDDIEIICVNDGSTDDSLSVLRKCAKSDSRVKIFSQKNSGVSVARNHGIGRARSEFIMFCDSDDRYDPNMCEKLYKAVTSSGAEIAMCGVKNIGVEKHAEKRNIEEYFRIKFPGLHGISDTILLKTDVSPCNKVFRKSLIDKYHIEFPKDLRFEDNYFFLAYASVSKKIYFIDEYLYNYVRHGDSFMSTSYHSNERALDHFLIALQLYDFLINNSLYIKCQTLFWRTFISFYNFSWRYAPSKQSRRQLKDLANDFTQKHSGMLRDLPKALARQVKTLTSVKHTIRYKAKNAARAIISRITPAK